MPFLVSQKCRFRQKSWILPIFCHWNMTIRWLYCNIFTEFPCYVVRSLLPKVWSHCYEHFCPKSTKHTCAVDVKNIATYLLIQVNDMNINILKSCGKKQLFCSSKCAILLHFVKFCKKNQYFRHKGGFSSFRPFFVKNEIFGA